MFLKRNKREVYPRFLITCTEERPWHYSTDSDQNVSTYIGVLVDRFQSADITSVGSSAGGTYIAGQSDMDFMIVPKNVTINEAALRYNADVPCYLKINVKELEGEIRDVLSGSGAFATTTPLRKFGGRLFGWKGWPLWAAGIYKLGRVILGNDFVPQLRISEFTMIAGEFVDRKRNWPPNDVIKSVISGHFHITARPSPINSDPDHDFCLSFAVAETTLCEAMTPQQRQCLLMFKKILKYFLHNMCSCPCLNILTSYHIKTSAFWLFEQADSCIWQCSYLCHLVTLALEKLREFLKSGHFPHYFVQTANLLEGISKSESHNLASHINLVLQ